MKHVRIYILGNCVRLIEAFSLLAVVIVTCASGGPNRVLAQDSGDRAVNQAQRAVRQQILNREGGRGQTVLFNNDAQTEVRSNTEVRVYGTGTVSGANDSRNNNGRTREFSYEAIVGNRYRNNINNVSGIRYDWRGGLPANGRDSGRGDEGAYRAQSIYCASDDGKRHTCPVNTSRGAVRMVSQRSGSNCVQGRTWGYDRTGIWVDRGCRADFEVGTGRGDNATSERYGRGNAGYANADRPDGRTIYSGPIVNRHSDKAMDVTEQGMQDGANIQQWSYADQPNQNWDVMDLGNGDFAIISQHSGKALTVQGGRDNNGANIIQQGWNNSRQQRWRLEKVGGDYYRIVSADNGKVLDVTQQGKENGANIQLWDYANQANQQWRLKR
jgi:hypothetical protein